MAHASVVVLMQSLEQLLHPSQHLDLFEEEQIKSLHRETSLMYAFLSNSGEQGSNQEALKDWEARIRDVASKAYDWIDFHISNVSFPMYRTMLSWVEKNFSQILEEMWLINKELMNICYEKICDMELVQAGGKFSSGLSHPRPTTSDVEDRLVGVKSDVMTLIDCLTGLPLQLRTISVVGMGGIGKTFLTSRVYNDPYVEDHFYVRAWITVSRHYKEREMLLGILQCVAPLTDESRKSRQQLSEQLYRRLKGRRYLIVLDDMWDTKALNCLRRSLPDDRNGSRIMLTTRLKDVALCAGGGGGSLHCLRFLTADESWELFHSKIFVKESCPRELEELGRQIVRKCHGLPLAIVVVAGLLSRMGRTRDHWKTVAQSIDAGTSKNLDHCLEILALSYNYLPHHLKACFLYMGAFPEGLEIPVWKLIWLWIAEGFLYPVRLKCLEELAEEYLEDLISRNLVLVGDRRTNGRVKTCRIHDLLRDLCLREAEKEKFLHVMKRYAQVPLLYRDNQRRLSFNFDICSEFVDTDPFLPYTRTFLCFGVHGNLAPGGESFFMHVYLTLLRVLDILLLQFVGFPLEILDLVHLKYLAISIKGPLPASISKLLNLEILIVHLNSDKATLPGKIWTMAKLRHLCIKRSCHLPDPFSATNYGKNRPLSLQNLQTLSRIRLASSSKEVVANIPNVRKLEIFETDRQFEDAELWFNVLSNLCSLNQIETLKLRFLQRPSWGCSRFKMEFSGIPLYDTPFPEILKNVAFPKTLKHLAFNRTSLPWDAMSTVSMLPNLEVLKLRNDAFVGHRWEPIEGGFCQLKYLLMESINLVLWEASKIHFPSLQHLVLKQCHFLDKIPNDIAETTLQFMELHDCSASAVSSARQIQVEQEAFGNHELTVRITDWSGDNYVESEFPVQMSWLEECDFFDE